jgi:hypothetical protein
MGACRQVFFRPSGACSFSIFTQGLRPWLHSFAASRLAARSCVFYLLRLPRYLFAANRDVAELRLYRWSIPPALAI